MSDAASFSERLCVILDREFGERLGKAWPGQAAWIVGSPINEPVARALAADHVVSDHLTGITIFRDFEGSPEEEFLREFWTIDLHHGPYSSTSPYTEIEVIGARLTASIREALSEKGFVDFSESAEGFTARRTPEEAKKLRD